MFDLLEKKIARAISPPAKMIDKGIYILFIAYFKIDKLTSVVEIR